jgi:hypothetical protein
MPFPRVLISTVCKSLVCVLGQFFAVTMPTQHQMTFQLTVVVRGSDVRLPVILLRFMALRQLSVVGAATDNGIKLALRDTFTSEKVRQWRQLQSLVFCYRIPNRPGVCVG